MIFYELSQPGIHQDKRLPKFYKLQPNQFNNQYFFIAVMYSLLSLVAIVGFLFSLWIIKKKNVKLNMVESKKQKTVSFILNPQKNDTEAMIRSRVFFDEENHEDIIERLKNSYIHPCEKTFHAPVFKRRSRRSSVRFLFDFDTAAESKAPKSEGDREDHQTNFSSQDSLEESKS